MGWEGSEPLPERAPRHGRSLHFFPVALCWLGAFAVAVTSFACIANSPSLGQSTRSNLPPEQPSPATRSASRHYDELSRRCQGAGGRYSRNGLGEIRCTFLAVPGTEAECVTRGGTWLGALNGCSAETPDLCATIGGDWRADELQESWLEVPVSARPHACDTVTHWRESCEQIGFRWTRSGSHAGACAGPTDLQLDCAAVGGRWFGYWERDSPRATPRAPPRGPISEGCVTKAPDKGKPCRDIVECSGDCVLPARSRQAFDACVMSANGASITGVCSDYREAFWVRCTNDGEVVSSKGDMFLLVRGGAIKRCHPMSSFHSWDERAR